jgi:hypothetical protein
MELAPPLEAAISWSLDVELAITPTTRTAVSGPWTEFVS